MAQETPRWKANVRTVTSKAEELALTFPLLLFEKSHCALVSRPGCLFYHINAYRAQPISYNLL